MRLADASVVQEAHLSRLAALPTVSESAVSQSNHLVPRFVQQAAAASLGGSAGALSGATGGAVVGLTLGGPAGAGVGFALGFCGGLFAGGAAAIEGEKALERRSRRD